MYIDVGKSGELVLEEVYEPIILQTNDGTQLSVCMRDDTFELILVGSDRRFRVNTEDGDFEEM